MRITTIPGHELDITFRYKTFDSRTSFKRGKTHFHPDKRIETTCVISVVDDKVEGEGRFTEIAKGSTMRNPIDPFNKGFGRRIALKRALDNLPEQFAIAKKDRFTVVWSPYWHYHNDFRGKSPSGVKRPLDVITQISKDTDQPIEELIENVKIELGEMGELKVENA